MNQKNEFSHSISGEFLDYSLIFKGLKKWQGGLLNELIIAIDYKQENFAEGIDYTGDIQKALHGIRPITQKMIKNIDTLIQNQHFEKKVESYFKTDNYYKILILLGMTNFFSEQIDLTQPALLRSQILSMISLEIPDNVTLYKLYTNFDVYCKMCYHAEKLINLYCRLEVGKKESFQKYINGLQMMPNGTENLNEIQKKFFKICSFNNEEIERIYRNRCMDYENYAESVSSKLIYKIQKMPRKYIFTVIILLGAFPRMNSSDWNMIGKIILCKNKKAEIFQTLKSYSHTTAENSLEE